MKINVRTPAAQGAAYVYTCYSAIIAQTVGTPNIVKFRPRKPRLCLLGPSQTRKDGGFSGLIQDICKSCSISQDELLAGRGEE